MALTTYPKPIAAIEKKIRRRFTNATIEVDPPANSDGIWFLDITRGGHPVVVQ